MLQCVLLGRYPFKPLKGFGKITQIVESALKGRLGNRLVIYRHLVAGAFNPQLVYVFYRGAIGVFLYKMAEVFFVHTADSRQLFKAYMLGVMFFNPTNDCGHGIRLVGGALTLFRLLGSTAFKKQRKHIKEFTKYRKLKKFFMLPQIIKKSDNRFIKFRLRIV